MIDIARIALYESRSDFQDVFFSLVGILFQQLKSEQVDGSQAEDIQAAEAADRRFLEALLSFTISSDFNLLQQCSARMLAAPPAFSSRAERQSFYLNELRELSILSHTHTRATLDEEQSTRSRFVRVFLSVYQPRVSSMLNALATGTADNHDSDDHQCMKAPLAVGHLDEALEDILQILATASACSSGDSEATTTQNALALMFASYVIMCSHLRIPRVCMDLQHALAVARLRCHKPLKLDQLACYITNASQCRHFEALPSASGSASSSRLAMENALELARKSRSLESLVNFCSTSASVLAHECLKQVCVSQAKLFLNSKDLRFETRVEVSRQFELIHLQICENYISEMLGLLRELPLVLQFKHPIRGAEALTSDAFGFSREVIEQRFELFSKSVMTGTDDLSTHQTLKHPDTTVRRNSNRFWIHASREVRVRTRCLRLKTRILWHLRQLATSSEQSLLQVFERVFLIDFLSGRCGNSEEAKLVAKFIDKAQDAVSCSHGQRKQQTVGDYQHQPFSSQYQPFSKSSPVPSHPRRDKIIRSVALIVWAIWVRERCACCLRSIELLQRHDQLGRNELVSDTERAWVGSLAATCALQLNTLGVLTAKPDDIFGLQITLLEEAAKWNREKAVAVICWAFPADKVQARYLKRYKALRQTLKADASEQRATETATIEETEHRCQFIQRHVKKSIRWSITSGSMKPGSMYTESPKRHEMRRSWTSETDVLVDCCCDLEFQKLTWALIEKRFPGSSKAVHGLDEVNASQLKKVLLQSRASTAEGAVTRQEVMALLEEQKRNLEGKVRSWSMAPSDREEEISSSNRRLGNGDVPSQDGEPTAIARRETPAKHIVVRDIDSESDSDTPNRKRTQPHKNVQNVLKLLSLRKQNGAPPAHFSSSPDLIRRVDVPHSYRPMPSGSIPSDLDANPSPKHHSREASSHNNSSSSSPARVETPENSHLLAQQRRGFSSEKQAGNPQPLVFPLRYGVGVENAAIQLLERRHSGGGGRAIPLKARQFSFQQRERTSPTQPDRVPIPSTSALRGAFAGENVTNLKTADAQTDEAVDSSQSLAHLISDAAERRHETATQADKYVQCVSGDSNEAAIQCNLKERSHWEVSSAEEVPSSADRVLGRFPIFIHLDASTPQLPPSCGSLKKPRYLQVARFTDQRSSDQVGRRRTERVVDVSPGAVEVVTTAHTSEAEIEEAVATVESQSETSPSDSAAVPEARAAYQALYRRHFSTSTMEFKPNEAPRKSLLISSDRSSLLGLKEDMERLRTRLAQLEHCADEIDEDFKSSHHVRCLVMRDRSQESVCVLTSLDATQQLDRIGRDHDIIDLASQARLLDTIDNTVVDTTANSSSPNLPRSAAAQSALSRKASKDIHAAKKLIEAIEELTLDEHDGD